uniref:Uncharacterized protein n=1 Tax=Eutreptiella gymnastica TaxID=73025 RepID=A0A7S4GHL5_9EUGL
MPLADKLTRMTEKGVNLFDLVVDRGQTRIAQLEKATGIDINQDGRLGDKRVYCSNRELERMTDEELDRPEMFNAIHYDEAKAEMGTGDIILLHGTELFSMTIKSATRSWYSHVSLVIRDPPNDILKLYGLENETDPDGLYVFESDSETEDGREGGGVQMRPLRKWVVEMKRYYAVERQARFFLAWRRMVWKAPPGCPSLQRRKTCEFPDFIKVLHEAHGKSYEKKPVQMVASTVHLNQKEDLSSVFCSELVAWSYKALGIFTPAENASNWVPLQFSWTYKSDIVNEHTKLAGKLDKDRRLRIEVPGAECSTKY